MKYTLELEIDCGKETCAKEPGKFCKYFSTRRFGTIPMCKLFQEDLFIDMESDWHLRCQQCYSNSVPS